MSEAQSDQPTAPARGRSVKGSKALESLDFRRRTTGDQAAARSRLVRRLRIGMPIVALILVALFVLNTRSNSVDQAFLDDFKSMTAATEELRMANPRFAGVDDEGKPFEITADTALQNPQEKDVVSLQKPRAVQGAQEEMTVVTANTGFYRSEPNILELKDDVMLEHELGAKVYVLRSPEATVSIKDQIVTSDAGVGATGPDGAELKADKMTAYRSDGRVVFQGNVSMRIFPGSRSPLPAEKSSALRDEASETEPDE